MTKTEVLIVDDHPIVRLGLVKLINDESDLIVCGEASSVRDGWRAIESHEPGLVIVDLSLEDGSGLELVEKIRQADRVDCPSLVWSIHDESLYAERALRAGASGYVNKVAETEKILLAIRTVLGGDVYLSTRMTRRLLSQVVGQAPGEAQKSPFDCLSNRELEVFELIGHGLSTRQIALRLHLSPKTIETHREHIKGKLGIQGATDLTRQAVRWVLDQA